MIKKIGKKQLKFSKKMEKFKLIKFHEKYLKTIYNFRKDRLVKKNSLSKKKINFKKHSLWVKKNIKIKYNKIYIFLKNNTPIGTCSVIKKNNFFFFNYLIKKNFRSKGYSKLMIRLFLKKIKLSIIRNRIYAKVVKRNKISYKLLLKNKFILKSKKNKYYLLKLKI